MKKILPTFICAFLLHGRGITQQDSSVTDINNLLVGQTTMAVDWMQLSSEYRALAYQAFNTATYAFF